MRVKGFFILWNHFSYSLHSLNYLGGTFGRPVNWVTVLLVAALLAACVMGPTKSYEGEERKLEDVSVIVDRLGSFDMLKTNFRLKHGYVRLVMIDGIKAGSKRADNDYHSSMPSTDATLKVAVLPGVHKLDVSWLGWEPSNGCQGGIPGTITVCRVYYRGKSAFPFTAIKGHNYLLSFLQFGPGNDNWGPVMLDLTDQKQVFPEEMIPRDHGIKKYYFIGPGLKAWLNGQPAILE